jgi:hypothetical protein
MISVSSTQSVSTLFTGTGTYDLTYDFDGEIVLSASFIEIEHQLTDIDNNKLPDCDYRQSRSGWRRT